jgi:SpoVK/Ycf46/Vps4 family AAA+-type ATPase
MDTKLAFSLVKLIRAGVKGDCSTVADYAKQISDDLAEIGDQETSERIRAAINGHAAKKASIERLSPPMPVDSESRLSVADEILPDAEVQIVLPVEVQKVVDRFLTCIANAHQLLAHGVTVPASMIMYGPPGCGKSLLARYIAKKLELPLLLARSDSLISSYLGSTAKNIRSLFEYAASRRCILFLDEFDALAKMRDDQHELGELKRVVISLLQNIDANGSEYLLLAATNHEHLLDPAVWRRFAYSIQIGLPDHMARAQMLAAFLRGMASAEIVQTIAVVADGLSGAQLRDVADDAIRDAVLRNESAIDLFRSLGLVAERINGGIPSSVAEMVRLVKTRAGTSISQGKLAELFNLSQPTISRMLKDEGSNGGIRTAADQSSYSPEAGLQPS